MKAIVFAGGLGTRLSKLIINYNKHLLPLVNQATVIELNLSLLKQSGIKEVLLLINPNEKDIFNNFLKKSKFTKNIHVEIFETKEAPPISFLKLLLLSENFISNEDFLVLFGDNYFSDDSLNLIKKVIESPKDKNYLFLSHSNRPDLFGVPTILDNKIVKIVEKPKKVESNIVVTGLSKYSSNIFPIINNLLKKVSCKGLLTDLNNKLISENNLHFINNSNIWFDTGSIENYLIVRNMLVSKTSNTSLDEDLKRFKEIISDESSFQKFKEIINKAQRCNNDIS